MKLKKILFLLLFGLLFVGSLAVSPVRAANSTMNGLNATLDATGDENKELLKKSDDIENSAAKVIATILSFVGVAFLILMIYGGVLWMISQGEPAQVKKAKDIIINGIIGLVIVVFAYAITSYLGSTLTS
jgi:hypothetical protein